MYSISQKLKKVKLDLKTWSKSMFDNFKSKLDSNTDKLLQVEQKLASQPNSARLNKWHYRLIKQCEKVHLFNQKYWGKLAWKDWLVHGDRNSRYFHQTMKARKTRSAIVKIKDSSGVWIDNADEIKRLVNDFKLWFKSLSGPSSMVVDLPKVISMAVSYTHLTLPTKRIV